MFQNFFEIAYEAEVLNTEENDELLALAAELCNENVATRAASIQELRDMIYERGECTPIRTDDTFLLRFLRARDFIIPKAHRLMVKYCNFREQYPYLYKDVDLWDLVKVKNAFEGVLDDHPDVGRISIMRFGTWNPSEYPIEDLVRAGTLQVTIGIRQPKLQIIGGILIVDLEGITLRHVSTLTPTVAHQIISLLGVVVPARTRSCHFINYSWILNTFFYLLKRFIPEFMNKLYFHGYDLKSLQQHIDPSYLPKRYGGSCKLFIDFGTWLTKIKQYRTEEFDNEMKQMGYIIKE
ncbi:LOW QUALITY PROTEIN: clavesin-2 [Aphomia sociella]